MRYIKSTPSPLTHAPRFPSFPLNELFDLITPELASILVAPQTLFLVSLSLLSAHDDDVVVRHRFVAIPPDSLWLLQDWVRRQTATTAPQVFKDVSNVGGIDRKAASCQFYAMSKRTVGFL